MIGLFKKLFNPRTPPAGPSPLRLDRLDDDERKRRWESAETNRLNKAHWSLAADSPIQDDLAGRLRTLRTRVMYEAANNPIVDGVIRQWAADMVGEAGPSLQVRSDREGYNEALEVVWRDWWRMPDDMDRQSGPEMLDLWIKMLAKTGEALVQEVFDERAKDSIGYRLRNIHPRRLDTPILKIGDNMVVMGVELDKRGRAVNYHILTEKQAGDFTVQTGEAIPVRAQDMIHLYKMEEPDQVRGFPWLSSALDTVSELRDYDAQVLDAARAAADSAVFLEPQPEAFAVEAKPAAGTVSIERRQMSTIPIGYRMAQLNPSHPSTTYKEFRRERLGDVGRPMMMPLMIMLMDAQGQTYSTSRFTSQLYLRGLQATEGWIERKVLNRLVQGVATQARLLNLIPSPPQAVEFSWTWPRPPHVDPQKEAKAEETQLNNGTLTITKALASKGLTLEQYIAERVREKNALAAAGLDQPETDKGDEAANVRKVWDAIGEQIDERIDEALETHEKETG